MGELANYGSNQRKYAWLDCMYVCIGKDYLGVITSMYVIFQQDDLTLSCELPNLG